MARHTVGKLEDFADGTATGVDADGTSVVVWRSGDDVCVVRNRCPHLGLSLTKGPGGLHAEDGEIVCPWHSSRFDLCSGENRDWVAGFAGRSIPRWSRSMVAMGRKPSPLTTYPVSRDGDAIVVDIPAGG
jgi:nitrite reductase/ring-hydroxylating ferredoxin subunit